jgi:two-component system sensor histidine kinase BarA
MTITPLSSLKFKALALGLLPALVISLLLGGYLVDTRLADLHQAQQRRGQALANELAAISLYGLFTEDLPNLRGAARTFLKRPDVLSVTIRDRRGRIDLQMKNTSMKQELQHLDPKEVLRFRANVAGPSTPPSEATPDLPKGRFKAPPPPLGEVELSLADHSITRLRREVLRTAGLIVLAGILLTTVLALFMSSRVVRPIIRLSEAVTELKQGDLRVRVPEVSSGEIGVLEAGFNAMAERVAITQDELTREVEQTVEDLQKTMDELEMRNVELEIARRKALKASQAKSDFLAMISHEIRTPMNGISGFARLLSKEPLSPEQTQQVRAIRESAESLLTVINDVLDLSALESGRITFHPAPFRVRALVNGTVQLFSRAAEDKGLSLLGRVYDDVPDNIVGDAQRVRQVLINLLSNAIKFTPKGEVILRVMIDGDDEQPLITFAVSDTGIGISEESREALFRPFTQIDSSAGREYGGTGLGLSISKQLVEGMQGEIWVESTPEKGSVFSFSLPLLEADPDQAVPQAAHPRTDSTALSGLCVLVADDNAINLELARAILVSHGMHPTLVQDGQQATEAAGNKHFDLILMDVHMPGLSGVEAARRIRAGNGPNAKTPIIAITADVMPRNQRRIFEAGMDEVIFKPMDEDKLLRAMAAFFPLAHQDMSPEPRGQRAPRQPDPNGNLPARDPQSALDNAAGNHEVAERLLQMLLDGLDAEIQGIQTAHAAGDFETLWTRAHKLLGAASICGVPALHAALRGLQDAASTRDAEETTQWMGQVTQEAKRLKNATKSQAMLEKHSVQRPDDTGLPLGRL